MKRFVPALLALLLASFALGSAAPAWADLNVCIWGTITGPDALVNGMAYGPRDYFEFLNQTKGGIAGNKVNALLLDGRYKLDEELKIYRRCVDQENAVFVNGWSTGSTKALREQITSDAVPFVTQSFAGDVLDPVKLPYIFMAGPTYEQQMIIGLRDLVAKGGKRIVLMHGDNEYGRGPVSAVRQSGVIEKLGLQLADTVEFRYDAQDLTAQMLRVKSRNPDMIYIQSSTPQAIVILRDAAKVGLSAKLFMGNLYNISPTIPEQLGEAAEGFRAIQAYAAFGSDIPAMKDIDAFKARNKIAKEDVYYMKGWFEGIAMAAAIENAIKKNGGTVPSDLKAFRKSVRDEMEALTNLDDGGITPPLDFRGHQGSTQARIAEIKGGKYLAVSDWIDAR
jgi:branched-chain amino acid transport system substrate-binding protein